MQVDKTAEGAHAVGIQPFEGMRLHLQQEFLRRCRANSRYSLRGYARALGIEPSALSKLLKGQRTISPSMFRKLGTRLGIAPGTLEAWAGRPSTESDPGTRSTAAFQQIALDHFEIIADWYHYAILELTRVQG